MTKKLFAAALFCALISAFQTSAEASYPPARNESFAVRTLQTLHSAEVTYQATAGNGSFGSLNNLRQANLIDAATASGNKNGYHFVVQTTAMNGNTSANFTITATPQRYRKTGRKSFYIDISGVVRGADKNGLPATADDPIIENLCSPSEECTIANLRTLHSAEVTYSATSGNGSYGTLNQLCIEGLVNKMLAGGYASGYNFTITFTARTNTDLATFSISAVPIIYGVTGIRSFYIATDGVMHAADKHGTPATADDPVIEY